MSTNGKITIEQMLESAVVASWADLTRGTKAILIHIEYGFTPGGTLDYLKVWSSITWGHWLLVCAYWKSPSTFHSTGFHSTGIGIGFENGYQSEGLAHILELVIQHQDTFVLPPNLGRQVLLQISTPTEEVIAVATACLRESVHCLESPIAESVLA